MMSIALPTQRFEPAPATSPMLVDQPSPHALFPLQENLNIVNSGAPDRLRQLQHVTAMRMTEQTPQGVRSAASTAAFNLGAENRILFQQNRSPKQIATYNELRLCGIPPQRIRLDPPPQSYVQPKESLKRTMLRGDAPTLSLRVLHGANPEETDAKGTPALVTAAKLGNVNFVRILAGVNADQAATDAQQRTALLAASAAGKAEIVIALLTYFPPLDAVDAQGMSALMYLCASGHRNAVTLLLAEGADPRLVSKDGSSARELALRHGHHEIVADIDAALCMEHDSTME